MALVKTFYNAVLRRTSTFALTIAVGAFVFERAFDMGVDTYWRTHNKGVRRFFILTCRPICYFRKYYT